MRFIEKIIDNIKPKRNVPEIQKNSNQEISIIIIPFLIKTIHGLEIIEALITKNPDLQTRNDAVFLQYFQGMIKALEDLIEAYKDNTANEADTDKKQINYKFEQSQNGFYLWYILENGLRPIHNLIFAKIFFEDTICANQEITHLKSLLCSRRKKPPIFHEVEIHGFEKYPISRADLSTFLGIEETDIPSCNLRDSTPHFTVNIYPEVGNKDIFYQVTYYYIGKTDKGRHYFMYIHETDGQEPPPKQKVKKKKTKQKQSPSLLPEPSAI